MPTPTNKDLYNKIKQEVYKDIPKHSLFRSAQVVRQYKDAGGKYTGAKNENTGITGWFKDNWVSINDKYRDKNVKCGASNTMKKYGEYPLCKPATIANKLSKPQMKKLIDAKTSSKAVRTEKVLDTDKFNVRSN
jgi:uncharacterized phage-associated protein